MVLQLSEILLDYGAVFCFLASVPYQFYIGIFIPYNSWGKIMIVQNLMRH